MAENDKDLISKGVDFIFDIRGVKLYLLLIFLLGFTLRLIAALNLGVSADDMHFATHAINFFSAGRLETYDQSSGLWFAFTSIMYKVFGFTQLGSRIAALIFGAFSILVIYLLSREFFDEKVSLISAFLLAIAPFHIKLTIAEQDVMTMFFVLLGMLLFVRGMKVEKTAQFALSGIFMGLAIYTKVYPLLFIPSLLLYAAYFKRKSKEKIIESKNIKKIIVFLFFIFIFTIPALTHNYLLYKDKGFLDLQFTRTTGLGKNISAQYYAWDHQFNAKNDWKGLIFGNSTNSGSDTPTLVQAVNYIRVGDPIIFYLGISGILILLFYRNKEGFNKEYLWFFILSVIIILPFLASIILLPKHFIFLSMFLMPIGAFAVNEIIKKLNGLINKDLTKVVVIILLILSLILLGLPKMNTVSHFYGKSAVAQVIDFKESNIPKNSLVIADSRIYRGQIHWILRGRPYLEGSDFVQVLNQQEEIPGEYTSFDVYYVECATDDCGWGTIAEQPEFNATMEGLTEFFKTEGKLIKEIYEPNREEKYYPLQEKNKINIFNIYSGKLQLKMPVLEIARQPKEWFLYTIGYQPKEKQFDYYSSIGFPNTLLYQTARIVVWLSLILSLISIIYLIYILAKRQDFFPFPNLERAQEPKSLEGS